MSGRFMKIKRIVIPFISVVILISQLTGCAALSSQEMIEEINTGQEVVLEYNELDQSNSMIAYGYEDQISKSEKDIDDADDLDIGLMEEESGQNDNQELNGSALEEYFQLAYDACSGSKSSSDEQISFELEMIESFCYTDKKVLPSDYADQYSAWRPGGAGTPAIMQNTGNKESETSKDSVVVLTFNDVNETVYATGQVNIRSNPSTNAEKLGSLASGNSITRTGIGTGNYSSWSRVQLNDGTIAYISSNYLSTTKPASNSNSSTPSSNQNHTTPATSQSTSNDNTSSEGEYSDSTEYGIIKLVPGRDGTIAGDGIYEGTLSDTAP